MIIIPSLIMIAYLNEGLEREDGFFLSLNQEKGHALRESNDIPTRLAPR